MGGKGKIRGHVLIFVAAAVLWTCGCSVDDVAQNTTIRFICEEMVSKAMKPDESMVRDLSLLIFDEQGQAEECRWSDKGDLTFETRLLTGRTYTICACANFGKQICVDNISGLEAVRYHLAYPDDYRQGMPMFARQDIVAGKDDGEICIRLERLMAKISIQMDRRMLSDDVEMYVRSVKIGNCPRSANVFTENKVMDEDDCFPVGFLHRDMEVDGLNTTSDDGRSKEISLYMLENMQGYMDTEIYEDDEKTFGKEDHRRKTCSYVELELEYNSDKFYSNGKGLVYRFYLGEDRNNLDVERNCHYHITVTPEDDGLSYGGWRVDKSGLYDYGPPSFKAYPSDYIVGDIGDRIHIWCEVSPRHAPFDVGISYMEDDRKEGIYDYEIDEDGYGATLTLTGPGRGLIYMEAGDPVNEAALFIIEVNLPQISGSM